MNVPNPLSWLVSFVDHEGIESQMYVKGRTRVSVGIPWVPDHQSSRVGVGVQGRPYSESETGTQKMGWVIRLTEFGRGGDPLVPRCGTRLEGPRTVVRGLGRGPVMSHFPPSRSPYGLKWVVESGPFGREDVELRVSFCSRRPSEFWRGLVLEDENRWFCTGNHFWRGVTILLRLRSSTTGPRRTQGPWHDLRNVLSRVES